HGAVRSGTGIIGASAAAMNPRRRGGDGSVNSSAQGRAQPLRPRSRPYTAAGMPKILVVEDEPSLVDALEFGLVAEGFDVVATGDGEESLRLVDRERRDLVLLDLMLPGLPGTEVCKRVRASSAVPIIMQTARGTEIDKVVGL